MTVAAPPVGARSVVSIRRVVVLPAAVGSEQSEDLAGPDGEVDSADGLHGAVPGGEGPGEPGRTDDGHGDYKNRVTEILQRLQKFRGGKVGEAVRFQGA